MLNIDFGSFRTRIYYTISRNIFDQNQPIYQLCNDGFDKHCERLEELNQRRFNTEQYITRRFQVEKNNRMIFEMFPHYCFIFFD